MMLDKIKKSWKKEEKEEVKLRNREARDGDILGGKDISWIPGKVEYLKREEDIERVKKSLERLIVEFDNEAIRQFRTNDIFITEIYFWLTLSRQFRNNEVISEIVKVRFSDLELQYNLSEEEALLKHWIAEIFYNLKIIDFLDNEMAGMWLFNTKTT
ncbi:hypothetical protein [Streptococcus pluranimalium]|uniref:hypothetical protein n=1 Tax=Streptococcus pluranimalium TaxID=82348 RepID=UPI003F67BA83